MTPALAVLVTVLAAPTEVVVVRRDTSGVPPAAANAIVRNVVDGLLLQQLAAGEVLAACSGDKACLAKTVRDAKAFAAIAVTAVKSRKGLTIDLEAVDADERTLGVQTFTVPPSGEPFPPEAADLFRAVAAAAPAPAPVETDAPKTVTLAPRERPARVEIQQPVARANVPLRAALGVSVGSGLLAVGLGIGGALGKSSLEAKLSRKPFILGPRADAVREASLTNGLFTGALISSLVAIASAGASVAFWAMGDDDGGG